MTALTVPSPVLADALPLSARTRPGAVAREIGLVVAGTVLLTLVSQVAIPLPFTPVPLTLGTFGALLVGAALGPRRGLASLGLYAGASALGAPILAGWTASGVATASFGYVIGYVLAGVALGAAARRGADRRVWSTGLSAAVSTMLVYVAGVPWLMVATGMALPQALLAGVVPFLVGDVIKALAVAALLPSAWRAVGALRGEK